LANGILLKNLKKVMLIVYIQKGFEKEKIETDLPEHDTPIQMSKSIFDL